MLLQLPAVGEGDEGFEGHDVDLVGVNEVMLEATAHIEAPEGPTLSSQNQVGSSGESGVGPETLGEADRLEWDLLLGRA